MADIIVFSKAQCPYCDRAKALLEQKGLPFEEVRVDLDPQGLQRMQQLSQGRTFPQIIINGEAVGGFDDLYALSLEGGLDNL